MSKSDPLEKETYGSDDLARQLQILRPDLSDEAAKQDAELLIEDLRLRQKERKLHIILGAIIVFILLSSAIIIAAKNFYL